jgi:hypothetical protein
MIDMIFATQEWTTLGEIKQAHRALLEQSDEKISVSAETIRIFVRQAVAAGNLINDPCERAEAQRLINYWHASLPAGDSADRIPIRNTILAPFDSTVQTRITADIDALLEKCPPSETLIAKQIFLRLVCLDPDGTTFSRICRNEDEVLKGLPQKEAKRLLESMIAKALIVRTDGQPGKLSLTNAPIIGRWSTGDKWLGQRRRYRGAVRFWRSHADDPAALLEPGELLDEATQYLDLDEVERSFAIKSIGQAHRRRLFRAGRVAVVLAIAVSAFFYEQKVKSRTATENAIELKDQMKEVEGARFDSATSAASWEETKKAVVTDLQKALKEITSAQAVVPSTNISDRLRGASTFLEKAMEALNPAALSTSNVFNPTISPGTDIVLKGSNSAAAGKAGVILWNPATKSRYLVAPNYLVPGGDEAKLFAQELAKDNENVAQPVATVKKTAELSSDPNELSLIQISDHVNATNNLPNRPEFLHPATISEATNSGELFLAGKQTNKRRGKILNYDSKSGLIRTTKISGGSDAGALVVTKEGKPFGVVVGSYGTDQSIVKPLAPFLEKSKLKVLPSASE